MHVSPQILALFQGINFTDFHHSTSFIHYLHHSSMLTEDFLDLLNRHTYINKNHSLNDWKCCDLKAALLQKVSASITPPQLFFFALPIIFIRNVYLVLTDTSNHSGFGSDFQSGKMGFLKGQHQCTRLVRNRAVRQTCGRNIPDMQAAYVQFVGLYRHFYWLGNCPCVCMTDCTCILFYFKLIFTFELSLFMLVWYHIGGYIWAP